MHIEKRRLIKVGSRKRQIEDGRESGRWKTGRGWKHQGKQSLTSGEHIEVILHFKTFASTMIALLLLF